MLTWPLSFPEILEIQIFFWVKCSNFLNTEQAKENMPTGHIRATGCQCVCVCDLCSLFQPFPRPRHMTLKKGKGALAFTLDLAWAQMDAHTRTEGWFSSGASDGEPCGWRPRASGFPDWCVYFPMHMSWSLAGLRALDSAQPSGSPRFGGDELACQAYRG